MDDTKWDRYFLGLAEYVAAASKDPSTKCGAVIADAKNRIVSLGYNGFPRGLPDRDDWLEDRDTKLALTLHAEENAIIFARGRAEGATLYVWPMPPCAKCAAHIIQAGIVRVVSIDPDQAAWDRWGANFHLANRVLASVGVTRRIYSPTNPYVFHEED